MKSEYIAPAGFAPEEETRCAIFCHGKQGVCDTKVDKPCYLCKYQDGTGFHSVVATFVGGRLKEVHDRA